MDLDLTHLIESLPDLCLFHRLTGLECPGCGMTHAFIALLHFDIARAFALNPFSPFLFSGLVAWMISPRAAARFVRGLRPSLRIGAVVCVIAFGVLRNTAAFADGYDSCSKRNNYLEVYLKPKSEFHFAVSCRPHKNLTELASFKQLHKICNEMKFPQACILRSLQKGERAMKYGACTGKTMKFSHGPRPCISERYHLLTYMSFVEAMSCMGVPHREIFPLLNHESHFHTNVQSDTHAWGAGQITGGVILDINSNHEDEFAHRLHGPMCEPLKALMQKPLRPGDICGEITPPNNPSRNLLYAAANYHVIKGAAQDIVKKHANALSGCSQAELAQVTVDLARMMYNGGRDGIQQMARRFFEVYSGAHFNYKDFRTLFVIYVRNNYLGGFSINPGEPIPDRLKGRRGEVSNYLKVIDDDLKSIETGRLKCS